MHIVRPPLRAFLHLPVPLPPWAARWLPQWWRVRRARRMIATLMRIEVPERRL